MDSNLPQLPISSETGDALAKPIAESVGNAGKDVLEGIFHLLFDPIRRFNIQRNYDLEKFQESIRETINDIPKENRDDSKINLTIKAIEDLRYQLNEEQIRDMFAALITSTLDNRKNNRVLPVFSTIISNMTPNQAVLLKHIYFNLSVAPFIRLYAGLVGDVSQRAIGQTLLIVGDSYYTNYDLHLSSLEYANLIEHIIGAQLSDDEYQHRYELGEEQLVDMFKNSGVTLDENEELRWERSYYVLTPIGKALCDIVFE